MKNPRIGVVVVKEAGKLSETTALKQLSENKAFRGSRLPVEKRSELNAAVGRIRAIAES